MADSWHKTGVERRRLRRHTLTEPVEVTDRISQSMVGRLVNVHTEGLMIMGNRALADECIYQLDLHLPIPINNRDTIELGVDCLWSHSQEAHVHWAGCRIIDISEEALNDLQALIELFGQTDDR